MGSGQGRVNLGLEEGVAGACGIESSGKGGNGCVAERGEKSVGCCR